MQIVPLEAAHLFDLTANILGWLLAAVQPKSSNHGTVTRIWNMYSQNPNSVTLLWNTNFIFPKLIFRILHDIQEWTKSFNSKQMLPLYCSKHTCSNTHLIFLIWFPPQKFFQTLYINETHTHISKRICHFIFRCEYVWFWSFFFCWRYAFRSYGA